LTKKRVRGEKKKKALRERIFSKKEGGASTPLPYRGIEEIIGVSFKEGRRRYSRSVLLKKREKEESTMGKSHYPNSSQEEEAVSLGR